MSNFACILDITKSIKPSTDELIWFVKPYFNGIFVQDCDLQDAKERTLFGDEIPLSLWYLLGLKYGKPDGNHIWTLIEGYRYIYNARNREFNIYNENGVVVYTVKNIDSIADMHIDFNVHKSHQFRIIIDAKLLNETFFKVVKLKKKIYGESPIVNIIATSCRNKYRTNNRHDYYKKQNIMPYAPTKLKSYKVNSSITISEIYTVGQVGKLPIHKEYSSDINKLYGVNIKAQDAKYVKHEFKAKALQYHVLLPILSITMFPWLCPILRQDEFLNNRPLFEPWLIWGVYKFLTLARDEEDSEVIPDVLDLSPNWNY